MVFQLGWCFPSSGNSKCRPYAAYSSLFHCTAASFSAALDADLWGNRVREAVEPLLESGFGSIQLVQERSEQTVFHSLPPSPLRYISHSFKILSKSSGIYAANFT